jgi:HK97 family phage prohead protease
MLIRNRIGEYRIGNSSVLLDFLRGELGMRPTEGGVVGVKEGLNVELVAGVPFCLEADTGKENSNAVSAIPNGIAWTFSTFDIDRFSERIDPEGWDYSHYLKNPVVEWAHRYDIPAIGKADGLFADDKGLHGSVVFNDKEYDPFGWAIGQRVKAGVIRAGSVGFRILEIELPPKEDSKDGTTLIFRKQELLEFSICNVPANPFALSKGMREGQKSELSPFWGNFIGGING